MGFPDELIERLVVGETPTLLEAEKGNELIDILNKLGNMSIDNLDGKVVWTDDGVVLSWKNYNLPAGLLTFKLLDAGNLEKQWVFKYEEGVVFSIEYLDSDWEEKEIEICENGSAVTHTFMVKRTTTAP